MRKFKLFYVITILITIQLCKYFYQHIFVNFRQVNYGTLSWIDADLHIDNLWAKRTRELLFLRVVLLSQCQRWEILVVPRQFVLTSLLTGGKDFLDRICYRGCPRRRCAIDTRSSRKSARARRSSLIQAGAFL